MREFLVCHDYGTGGLWWWMEAVSADDINARFRDVVVFDQPPGWWTDEMDQKVQRRRLSEAPDEALASLLRSPT
jgi:hypothetical protein